MLTALVLTGMLAKVQITDQKVGTGPAVVAGDVVTVLYKGTLKNGKVFDETTAQEPPYAFKVGNQEVIAGWDQGLVGMKVGGKRKLVVPAALAYGDRQMGDIPPKSDLTFIIELKRIDRAKDTPKIVIKETKAGSGRAAKDGDTVSVHYTGKFLNGFKFDSSVGKEPITVKLGSGRVVKGFNDGIVGLKVGGKRTVTIPFPLAYKEAGRPPVIPGYSTLVFELELVTLK